MKKVMPIAFKFKYSDASDSEDRLRIVYSRIFMIAKHNILERKRNTKQEYKTKII
jgi:hypothetical protein